MAVTKRDAITELGGILVTDYDADQDEEANVTGNTSGVIYLIDIDNTANTTAVYVKINDHASTGGPGTTPIWTFMGESGKRTSYVFEAGLVYSAGVTVWCTTGASVADNTDPAQPVILRLVAS
jgi:hypothetical protein